MLFICDKCNVKFSGVDNIDLDNIDSPILCDKCWDGEHN